MPDLNSVDHRGPVAGRSVEVAVLDPGRVHSLPHFVQEAGELTEDQRPVPLGDDIADLVHQGVQFGRRARLRTARPPDEASRLSCRSRVSDRKISKRFFGHVVDQAEDLLPLPLQVGLIHVAVLRIHLQLDDLFLLRRQVLRDLLLGPAEHQRPNPAP